MYGHYSSSLLTVAATFVLAPHSILSMFCSVERVVANADTVNLLRVVILLNTDPDGSDCFQT